MLPTFIGIGAVKAGTTSLYHSLNRHPEVHVSATKELNFFVKELGQPPRPGGNWSRGCAWYEQQFVPETGARAIGEISPRYAMHPSIPGVPQRIAELLPEVKLVYLVRDPIERMLSHYNHRVHNAAERRPLEIALTENDVYLNSSRYAYQIDQYLHHFPRSQLLLVVSEHLRSRREDALARVFGFIGVDPTWRDASLWEDHNVSILTRPAPRRPTRAAMSARWWKPFAAAVPEVAKGWGRRISHRAPESEISPELRRRLADLLHDDVVRLREYMDIQFDGWGIG